MKAAPKLVEKELNYTDSIPFIAVTKEYGRAEFDICPIVKRGKIRRVIIWPRQQPEAKHFYVVNAEYGAEMLQVNSWTFKGIAEPWVWRHWWCKEHKAMAFSVYAPDEAQRLVYCHCGESIGLYFDHLGKL